MVLAATLLALSVTYAVVLLRYSSAFRRLVSDRQPPSELRPASVTVVIPARNEAENIRRCIESVLANDYPAGAVEVIVVDDHSEDQTAEIVASVGSDIDSVCIIRLGDRPGGLSGKRSAIEAGIEAATGDIVLLTDADCEAPPTWIRSMVSELGERRFVSGPVLYRSDGGWLGALLELEMLGLVAIGAAAIRLGRPNMCNGASIGFRRTTFVDMGGYHGTESLTSGDDELLMHKISRRDPGSVTFCADPTAVVHATAPKGLGELFDQRRRWASKGLHYRRKSVKAVAVTVFLFNLSLFAGAVTSFWAPWLLLPVAGALALKVAVEWRLFSSAASHFGRRASLADVAAGQVFVIPYVVVIGLAGAFGGYKWKGRRIRR